MARRDPLQHARAAARALAARARILRVPRPTLRGAGLLAAGVTALIVAYATGRREFLFVSVVLVALPVLAAVYLLAARTRLTVTRSFGPAIVEAGRPTMVGVHVRNELPLASAPVVWRDLLPAPVGSTPPGAMPALSGSRFGADRSGEAATLRYSLTPDRRGVFPIGPLVLDEQDPFRLVTLRHAVGPAHDLVVTPRISRLPTVALTRALSDGDAHQVHRQSSAGEDDAITRGYLAGDPLRRVHWRATARHGELMVRQEEQRSDPEAVILLDTRAGRGDEDAEAFERAVEFTASLALHLRSIGCGVLVLETGRPVASRVSSDSGNEDGAQRDLLVRLAELERVPADDRDDAFPSVAGELRRNSSATPLFAVLGTVTDADADRLRTLRHWCDPAVAFLPPGTRRASRLALEDEGWTCITLDPATGPAAAWAALDRVGAAA
ncbi:DUF58 domain-containing protein [Planctomonas deserti]|uniref:DUF58 domain-containing protein n=1 Tax=Planctomonas deserti TaxID=2144185 RepID=UPI000D3733F4|nr:DUF58 domain-containing protein [Planctomonas deserti]